MTLHDWLYVIVPQTVGAGIYFAYRGWKEDREAKKPKLPVPVDPNEPQWPIIRRKSKPGDPPLIG
jgi:hypothetical protein